MITCNNIGYNGRFGNQLFQFAATIGIADKLGYKVGFPKKNILLSLEHKTNDNKPFMAKLDIVNCFDINDEYFTDEIIINNIVSERFFHFDEDLFKINDNCSLNGYFQSEKYFEHCKEKILNILKIKESLVTSAKELLPKTNKELVSIHIRRSDYLVLSDYHPINGVEYIESAIKELGDKDNYHFVICSDDIEWCVGIWGNSKNFTIIKSKSSFIDFTVMTLCDHHIISNSSFSWWSSYLCKNKNKKIIAPKNWFGANYSNYKLDDLYTKNMIKI